MSFLEPVPGYTWRPPGSPYSAGHQAVDIPAPCGTPVVAIADGVVAAAGWDSATPYSVDFSGSGGGNLVAVTHTVDTVGSGRGGIYLLGKRITAQYAHLADYSVRPGQLVRAGETIGHVGSTGHSTGCHLHFGFFVGGVPMDYHSYIGTLGLGTHGLSPTSVNPSAGLPVQPAPKDPFGNAVSAFPLDSGRQCPPGYNTGAVSPNLGGGPLWFNRPTLADGTVMACIRSDLKPGDNANTSSGQGLAAVAQGITDAVGTIGVILRNGLFLALFAVLLILGVWALVRGGSGSRAVAVA